MQEVRGSIPGRGTTDFCTLILFVCNFLYRAVLCFLNIYVCVCVCVCVFHVQLYVLVLTCILSICHYKFPMLHMQLYVLVSICH